MQYEASAPPLDGLRIIEFARLGPGPFAGMMLADMGVEVIRIERPGAASPTGQGDPALEFMARGRKSLALNLKTEGAADVALRLIEGADGLIEGFRLALLDRLGLSASDMGDRSDRANWPGIRRKLTALFLTQPRDYWTTLLQDSDACFAPVLSPAEAADHPHARARGIFKGPHSQPMPAPRFSGSKTPLPGTPLAPGANSRDVLERAGFTAEEISHLFNTGVVS